MALLLFRRGTMSAPEPEQPPPTDRPSPPVWVRELEEPEAPQQTVVEKEEGLVLEEPGYGHGV
jgi:hypothetical protein